MRIIQGSAQERTSAAAFRSGLAVDDPESLSGADHVLFSVMACALNYPQVKGFVK